MLMFDNAIFASFIPQILMVIAFVTCLISPKTKENDCVENVLVQVVDQDTQLQPSSTYFTTDEFYSAVKISKIIVYSAIDVAHWYPKSIRFSSFNVPEFRFSRPPPTFCCYIL